MTEGQKILKRIKEHLREWSYDDNSTWYIRCTCVNAWMDIVQLEKRK